MSALPFDPPPEATYGVAELCQEIKDLVGTAYGAVWVSGEVQRARPSNRGHLYFELVEKGSGDEILGKLDCVLWRNDHQRVKRELADAGQSITEGVEIRLLGRIDFWPPGGRLQLVARRVDPLFTEGLLARRRRETLAALEKAGLTETNRALELPPVPLAVALVTSHGSAAYHDFVSTLEESGYGFRLLFLHASVQGKAAEKELVSALRSLDGLGVDCVVLTRGGGSRSDLAVFDSRPVAEAVARCPVPVIAGLGHEIDRSIADRVAHTAVKTPTKAAELLIERVARQDRRLEEAVAGLGRAARERLRSAREALASAERGVELGRTRLERTGARLDEVSRALARLAHLRLAGARRDERAMARRLAAAAPRTVERRRGEPERLLGRIAAAASGRLREATATVTGLERLVRGLAPERLLERGYSITRGADGRALVDPAAVAPGEVLVTRLAGGELASRRLEADAEREALDTISSKSPRSTSHDDSQESLL